MEKEDKYYTPTIEEFCVGFEYEVKENFTDGTVKTQEEYDNVPWIHKVVQVGDIPYINRALNGRNAEVKISGIRVKYLDKEDIESLGYKVEQKPLGSWYKGEYDVYNTDRSLMDIEFNNIDPCDPIIIINGVYFSIKNKSEFSKLMEQWS